RRHAEADRATAQYRAGQDPGYAGHPRKPQQARRGGGGRQPRAIRGVHARGIRALAHGGESGRHQGGLVVGQASLRVARIRDWAALGAAARRQVSLSAANRARRLEPRLNAFMTIDDDVAVSDGNLGGFPYAVKDMFRTASHLPTGGLRTPTDLPIDGETELLAGL